MLSRNLYISPKFGTFEEIKVRVQNYLTLFTLESIHYEVFAIYSNTEAAKQLCAISWQLLSNFCITVYRKGSEL